MTSTTQFTKKKKSFFSQPYTPAEDNKIVKIVNTRCCKRKENSLDEACAFIAEKLGRTPLGIRTQFYKLMVNAKKANMPVLNIPRKQHVPRATSITSTIAVPVQQAPTIAPQAQAVPNTARAHRTRVTSRTTKAVSVGTSKKLEAGSKSQKIVTLYIHGLRTMVVDDHQNYTITCAGFTPTE